ncbi:hypothetical protein SynBIOSE41_00924 [Synechococcus sp. BIOS-E4-1]|nr:hypothetical protein SynBIOSE41_00924 [Synechococcus sp. BIOS-E4-1]
MESVGFNAACFSFRVGVFASTGLFGCPSMSRPRLVRLKLALYCVDASVQRALPSSMAAVQPSPSELS